ncbi:MAG: hypothetical protein GY839_19095 [candidate division Zixibacteria bacterium]|nr:hypothetical protein [candidate division Zixibacteria bacterium]
MRNRSICFLTVLFIAFAICSSAFGQGDDWYMSAANYARYYHFDSTKTDSAATRFQFDFYMGEFYTGAWFEAKHVMEESGFNFTSNGLTQRYFGWENKGFTIHAGNFYQVYDRGLALNTFRDDEVGVDLVLDGLQIDWRHKFIDFNVLSATSNSGGGFALPIVRGARAKIKPLKMFHLGGAYVSFTENTRTNLSQVNARFLHDYGEAYIEYAQKKYRYEDIFDPALSKNLSGDGTYANIMAYYSNVSLFLEYKNYIFLIYPELGYLNTPPAANRQDRLLQTEAFNSFQHINGERGYRGNLTFSANEYWSIEFDYSKSIARDTLSMKFTEQFAEIRGNYFGNNTFFVNLDKIDYSWTANNFQGQPTHYYRNELKPMIEIDYELDDFHLLTLDAFIINYDLPSIADTLDLFADSTDYSEKNISLTFSKAPYLRFTLGGSWSDNEQSHDPDRMIFAEATYTFGNHDLVLFYGGQRGGLVCSGGVCVYHDTFEGFRATLISRL